MNSLPLTPERRALLQRLEQTAGPYTNISPENGAFLSLMLRAIRAKRVLEIGTSNGYSTLYLAFTMEQVGGEVVTIERDPERAEEARQNFRRAGVESRIELRVGDALEQMEGLTGEWDFVFLDAEKSEYRKYVEAIWPSLRPGGLVAADDTESLRANMPDFVEWAFSATDAVACDVSIDDGLILCWKSAPESSGGPMAG